MTDNAARSPLLKVESVSKNYIEGTEERHVLRDVSFSIYEGELVVLLGRSGSGKSTLLNLINGMDTVSSGHIYYRSDDFTAFTEREKTLFRRHNIGIIFQSFNLIPTLTVLENMILPMQLSGGVTPESLDRASQILEQVGLDDRADSFPDRLSGGEQQRVALARALAHDPAIILADEPTGNLDFATANQILDILRRLVQDENKTLLVATHDLDILSLADRVVWLQDGVLKELDRESAYKEATTLRNIRQ